MNSNTATTKPASPVRELQARTESVLDRILEGGAETHAAWLETLSLLEFTGARKIAGTFSHPTKEVLSHLAEEARHARFFGAMAERVRPREATTTMLAARDGLLYFHRLDDGIARDVRRRLDRTPARPAVYYHVTAAVEERALELYETYNILLKRRETGLRLDRVIAEERGHLTAMYRSLEALDPDRDAACDGYRALEARLFAEFLDGIESSLS